MPRRTGIADNPQPIASVSGHECLAKTFLGEQGRLMPGQSVYSHCLIVGEVARQLTARFPESLRQFLFPPGCGLISACHDIGKLSPTFYLRLQIALSLFSEPVASLLDRLGLAADGKRIRAFEVEGWGGHAGVSGMTLLALTNDRNLSVIVGQHHGLRPPASFHSADDEVFGGSEWQAERMRLVEELQQALGETWPVINSFATRQIVAGLTAVSDWIGSGPLFDSPDLHWREKIPEALDMAGMVMPRVVSGLSFGDIFQDEEGVPYKANTVQTTLFDAINEPGVYVLEAPMGVGKTEAALYAAYKMLASGQARGIYFALPTQLTSNKIHHRFIEFLQAILELDSPNRQALLLHGKARLQTEELGEEGKPGGSWFASRKCGLLAPFAVGTLDQALMAAMNVKYGFVRAFGLAGKVVILDEIHSYDAYTSIILSELVTLLRELRCTVIVLSATLTDARCRQLLPKEAAVSGADTYPVIISSPGQQGEVRSFPLDAPSSRRVRLHFCADGYQPALEEALRRAESGEQVLWLENTVNEAQNRYLELAARCHELGLGCGLLHSRFTSSDRTHNEELWVNTFGKPGWSKRKCQGRILIGTQVLEQSIDIDADFLISRFAPTDLLMQRLGRLWRHERAPRSDLACCEAWILVPQLSDAIDDPYRAFGATAWVYSPYVLCRSLAVWLEKSVVTLPLDIRPMLEATYREQAEEGNMGRWLHELLEGKKSPVRKGIHELQQLARLTLSTEAQTLQETHAQTRYSEQDNASILLLSAFELDVEDKLTRLRLLNGQEVDIPWQRFRLPEPAWRKLATMLEDECVPVRSTQCIAPVSLKWAKDCGLGHLFWLGGRGDDSSELHIALVDESGDLRGINGISGNSAYHYQYRRDTGLRITKKE